MPIKNGPDGQIVVVLGIGDVMIISHARQPNETVERCVTFHQNIEARPVGEKLNAEAIARGSATHAPVLIKFENEEGIDALVAVLEETRRLMANCRGT